MTQEFDTPMAEVTISHSRKIGMPNYSSEDVFACVKIKCPGNSTEAIRDELVRAEMLVYERLELMIKEVLEKSKPSVVLAEDPPTMFNHGVGGKGDPIV